VGFYELNKEAEMGIFDKAQDQAKATGKEISDNLEQEANERTGNKYSSQIDNAQRRVEDQLGINSDDAPGQ
jgi:F0F1-type ATP synthase membrane subunit b/b'